MYSWPSSRGPALVVAALVLLQGCGLLERIFDPVDDPGRLILVEPKFPRLQTGQSVELRASVIGEPDVDSGFEFREDSGGIVLRLEPQGGNRVLATALGQGQATVMATLDEDEGLAVVTVE